LALTRRRFRREFARQVVRAVEAGKLLAQAAREYQLHPTVIVGWHKEHLRYAEQAVLGNGHLYKAEARIAELERLIGQLTMEDALLKKPCRGSRGKSSSPPAMEGADARADH
jgi:transposase